MEDRKVLLSIKNLKVKFRVRGRILTAIRDISLDIYENESIAVVGESGSGKSVFTKTFAGMLDSNGYVSDGKIIFNDEELADTTVKTGTLAKNMMDSSLKKLNDYSKLEFGAATYREILALEAEKREKSTLSEEEKKKVEDELKALRVKRTENYNLKQTLDPSKEKANSSRYFKAGCRNQGTGKTKNPGRKGT
jgi:oligopeptide transport system ATP-binding protein